MQQEIRVSGLMSDVCVRAFQLCVWEGFTCMWEGFSAEAFRLWALTIKAWLMSPQSVNLRRTWLHPWRNDLQEHRSLTQEPKSITRCYLQMRALLGAPSSLFLFLQKGGCGWCFLWRCWWPLTPRPLFMLLHELALNANTWHMTTIAGDDVDVMTVCVQLLKLFLLHLSVSPHLYWLFNYLNRECVWLTYLCAHTYVYPLMYPPPLGKNQETNQVVNYCEVRMVVCLSMVLRWDEMGWGLDGWTTNWGHDTTLHSMLSSLHLHCASPHRESSWTFQ